MKRSATWYAWLLVCVAVHATLPSLRAQQENLTLKQGTQVFRRLLHLANIKSLKTLQDLDGDEKKKLLIVLGETRFLDDFNFRLDEWVSKGGAVLIATDRAANGSSLEPFNADFVSDRAEVSVSNPACYKESKDCMFLRSTVAGEVVFKKLQRVATNISGYMYLPFGRPLPGGLRVFADFPPGYRIVSKSRSTSARRAVFAIGGQWESGRVLFLADHSIFINIMLLQDDNDNLEFAKNCVHWLTDNGSRKEALFYEEGTVQTDFNTHLPVVPAPPLPPPEQLVAAIDQALMGIEEENGFNRMLNNLIAGTKLDWRGVFVILTAGLCIFLLSRLTLARQRREPGVPLLASGLTQLVPVVEVLDQRHRAMLREGNFFEVAQQHARQGFGTILGAPFAPGARAGEKSLSQLPPLQMRGSLWQRWSLHRLVRRLWGLAYAAQPRPISLRKWRRIEEDVRDLQSALRDGTIQVAWPNPGAPVPSRRQI